jgi:hypothetical protein
MAVSPLTGKFIQAKGYTRGRSAPVRLLVLHTAEGSTTVEGLGNYFAGTTKGSSNAGVGQQGQYAEFVTYNNTPWTNPPVNSVADTLEMCAFKAWSRTEWMRHPDLLETVAHWIAWRAAVRGIPIIRVRDASKSGVCDHLDVNNTYHKSTHSDIGVGFPWDTVMARAASFAKVPVAPLPVPTVKKKEDDMYIAVSPKGTYALFTGGRLYPLSTSQVHTLDWMGLEAKHCNDTQWKDLNDLSKAVAG